MKRYLEMDEEKGEIYLDNVKVSVSRRDAAHIIQSEYERLIGPAARVIFNEASRESHRNMFAILSMKYSREKQDNLRLFTEKMLESMSYFGYGLPEMTFFDERMSAASVRIYNCYNKHGYPNLNKPICYIVEGVIASLFEVVFEKRMICRELKCASMGNNYCEFKITSTKIPIKLDRPVIRLNKNLKKIFYEYNPKNSFIRHNKMNSIFIPRDFQKRVEKESERVIGTATKEVWYMIGRILALEAVGRNFLQGPIIKLLKKIDKKIFIRKLESINSEYGYGVLKWLEVDDKSKTSLMKLKNSWNAEGITKSKKPTCYLTAGLYAGANDIIFGTTTRAEEVRCKGMGHPECIFKIYKEEPV